MHVYEVEGEYTCVYSEEHISLSQCFPVCGFLTIQLLPYMLKFGFNLAIFAGPCSIREIKNFVQQSSHSPAPFQSQVTMQPIAIHVEAPAVVCASMMMGRVTAVYYVRARCDSRNKKPAKISSSGFWSQSAKYCPSENVNLYSNTGQ